MKLLLPDEVLLPLLMGKSSCDDVDEVDRNVRAASELLLLCVIPESGDVLQLIEEGTVSVSMERRVLSNSVEANATKRSNPELTRCCQWVSSSAAITSSIQIFETFIGGDIRGGLLVLVKRKRDEIDKKYKQLFSLLCLV